MLLATRTGWQPGTALGILGESQQPAVLGSAPGPSSHLVTQMSAQGSWASLSTGRALPHTTKSPRDGRARSLCASAQAGRPRQVPTSCSGARMTSPPPSKVFTTQPQQARATRCLLRALITRPVLLTVGNPFQQATHVLAHESQTYPSPGRPSHPRGGMHVCCSTLPDPARLPGRCCSSSWLVSRSHSTKPRLRRQQSERWPVPGA